MLEYSFKVLSLRHYTCELHTLVQSKRTHRTEGTAETSSPVESEETPLIAGRNVSFCWRCKSDIAGQYLFEQRFVFHSFRLLNREQENKSR